MKLELVKSLIQSRLRKMRIHDELGRQARGLESKLLHYGIACMYLRGARRIKL